MNYITNYISQIQKNLINIDISKIENLVELLQDARSRGTTVFTMGNGGSASTASHWVNDLVKGASYEKTNRFKVICLNDSISTVSAYSNDVGYEFSLEEPLKNFLQANDLVIAISGSGNSENVIRAINYAKTLGANTVALTGRDGGKLGKIVDLEIRVNESHMGRIEDLHMMITHITSWSFIDGELA